jgi:hypothetical protein
VRIGVRGLRANGLIGSVENDWEVEEEIPWSTKVLSDGGFDVINYCCHIGWSGVQSS